MARKRAADVPPFPDPLPSDRAIYAALKVWRNHITSERFAEITDDRAAWTIWSILNAAGQIEAALDGARFGLDYEFELVKAAVAQARKVADRAATGGNRPTPVPPAESPTDLIETIVARPGWIGRTGDAYSVETLRGMADNKTLFWDEDSQTLYYRGPRPEEKR